MAYDLALFNSTNARNSLDLVQGVNTASSGSFGLLLLATVFFFLSIAFRKAGLEGIDNFLASGLASSVIAALLFFVEVVAWYVVLIPFAIFLILLMIKSMN